MKHDLSITNKNFENLQKFIDLFQQDRTLLKMNRESEDKPKAEKGKYFKNTTEVYSGDLTEQPFLKEIVRLQNSEYYLWFLPNQTDGILYPTDDGFDYTAANNHNITHFSSCFVDTDEGNVENVEKFCKRLNLPPHIRVKTSPTRHHLYFLIEKVENTIDTRFMWEAVQRRLFSLDPKFDHSLAKPCQLMRVPFFYHNKKTPRYITAERDKNVPLYTLEDLYERTEASNYAREIFEKEKLVLPTELIESGSRHERMFAHLNSMSNKTTDPGELAIYATGFATTYFKEYKDFLRGGSRQSEIHKLVTDVINYRKAEEVKAIKLKFDELDKRKREDKFYLPDQFYYDCPNNVGGMVKEISEAAQYPAPAIAFAGVLSLLGFVKSHLYVTDLGHAPANYFLVLAPTGRGKDSIQGVLSRVIKDLCLTNDAQQDMTSEKGLYRALAMSQGRTLVMLDEAEQLFQSLTSDKLKVEAYQKGIKRALLRLYSCTNKSFKSGLTSNTKDVQWEFQNAHLNFCSFGTPTTLSKGFSTASIKDGFLVRFLITSIDATREMNPNADPNYKLSEGYLEWLRSIDRRGNFKREKELAELKEMQEELDDTDSPSRKKELKQLIDKSQKENSLAHVKATKIRFTEVAKKQYKAFQRDMDQLYNKELERNTGLGDLYTRAAEQVGRLCAVIANGEVKPDIVEYGITFVKSRIDALRELVGEGGGNLSDGLANARDHQEYYALMGFFEKRCRVDNDYLVRRREVFRYFKWDAVKINKLLLHAREAGDIREVKQTNKNGAVKVQYQLVNEAI